MITLPLSATLGTFSRSGTLVINWTDLNSPSTITVDSSQIAEIFNFNDISVEDALEGLLELPGILSNLLESTKFAVDIPVIGDGLKGLVNIADRVSGWMDQLAPLGSNGIRAPTFNSAATLETRLEQILNAAGVPFDVDITVANSEVQFVVLFKQNIVNQNISFAIDEGFSGLGLQADGNLLVNGAVEVKVRFGLAYGEGIPLGQRFFIIPGVDSSATLSFRIDAGINATGSLGLINITAVGTARVGKGVNQADNATLSIALVDPGTDTVASPGKITLSEILNDPLAVLGSLDLDGSANVTFEISSNQVTPQPDPLPGVIIDWADLNNLSPVVTPTGDLTAYIAEAANFNLANALNGIQSILSMISDWTGLAILDTEIPLINRSIGDLFDFVAAASEFFNQLTGSGAATAEEFNNEIQLALLSAGFPAGAVPELFASSNPAFHDPTDLSNPRIRYLFRYHHDFLGTTIPFDWGNDLFSLMLDITPSISFDLQLEFGFSKELGFYIVDRDTAPVSEVTQAGLIIPGGEVHLSAGVTIDDFNAGGNFGPVTYGVLDGDAMIDFGAALDLQDPNNSGGIITPRSWTRH
jgi:hypothetical protein